MKIPSLLPLLLPLLVVSLPPAAAVTLRFMAVRASPYVECVGKGVYAANSTYEANRRRLAGLLLAETAAAKGSYFTDRAVGYWPNRAQAIFYCPRRLYVDGTGPGDPSSSCAACIVGAFLEVERECPYHRVASFYSRNCTLEFTEFRIFGSHSSIFKGDVLKQAMASGLILQAIGFAWLFFLLLQEWRSRKRGTLVHSEPLLSGE